MTDLAKLVISLQADSARLQKDLDKAQSQINKFQAQAAASFRKLVPTIDVYNVSKDLFKFLGSLTTGVIKVADEFSLLAQKTGISVEALSQLDFAAKQSGVEDLATGLIKFNRSISEAAQGSRSQADAFKSLGINVKDANGNIKTSEALFLESAEALSKYRDGANKTAIVLDLFGKAGAELIPLLNEGEEGIRKFREQADKLGLTLSTETAQAANDFNDALDTIKFSVAGVGRQLVTDLAPKMREFADFISDPTTIASLSKFGEAIVTSLGAAVTTVAALTSGVTRLYAAMTDSPTELVDVLDEIAELSERIADSQKDEGGFDFLNDLSPAKLEESKKRLAELIALRDKLFSKQREELARPSAVGATDRPDAGRIDSAKLEAAAKKAADDAKKIAEAAQKAAEEALSDRLDAELKLNEKVNNARQDLFEKTVTRAEAETTAIETKYEALIAELVAAGRDVEIPLVVELMGVEKAQADFTRLTEELEEIRRDHERRMEEIEQSVITGARSPLEGIRAQEDENSRFAGESESKLGEMEALGGLSPDQQAEIVAGYEDVEDRKTEALIAGEEARRQVQEQYMNAGLTALGDAAEAAAAFGKKGFKAFKAFAIAQTIISTYDSAQKAYSSLASIPYVGPALGIAAAAAAIGAGLARVAAIRSAEPAGYMEGGYTGNGPRTSVVGQVHGQEGVVSTSALSAAAEAINDPNFWSVSRNANAAMAAGATQINIVNQPGIVTIRQDDGTLLNRLAPALMDMVDIDQERRTTTGLGRNFRATASKIGGQPSSGR